MKKLDRALLTALFAGAFLLAPLDLVAQELEEDPYAPIVVPSSEQTVSADPSNLLNPNISIIATFLGSYLNGDPLPTSGHNDSSLGTGLALQEIELAFQAAVDPFFRLDAFFAISGDEFEIDQLDITTLAFPTGLQLQVGYLLAEFGRQNQRHLEMWEMVDQHLPNQLILQEHLGGPGAELSYLIPTGSRAVMLQISGQVFDATAGGMAPLQLEDLMEEEQEGEEHEHEETVDKDPEDIWLSALGRLEAAFTFNPSWTLVVGGSAIAGPNGAEGAEFESFLYGVDLYLRYRQTTGQGYQTVSLTAEGIRREREMNHEDFIDHGAYGQLFWRFTKRWSTAVRYDWADGDSFDEVMRGSASLSFSPSEFSRIRAQYSAFLPNPDADWAHQGMLQLEFSVGPHGAHPF